MSGGISDAQARYNLSNLSANGMINPSEVAIFSRLLAQMQLNPGLAQATAELIASAQRRPEAAPADGLPIPQPIKPTQLDDLLAVPGISPELLDRLKEEVIFLPRATPVNVNTASAQVLSALIDALTPDDAAELVASRNTASFRDLADFTHRLPGKVLAAAAEEAVSVTSNYFLVKGKVRMSPSRFRLA